jgi:uncharacterized protein (DUF1697 family)
VKQPDWCGILAPDMTMYIALLRAVNVGGTGKLLMSDLKDLCAAAGFRRIETYIASGNVVFSSDLTAAKVQAQLAACLSRHAGKSVGVFVRTAAELRGVLERCPFSDKDPKRIYVFFLDQEISSDALDDIRGRTDEELQPGQRELYVFYPMGMGQSKLRIPAARSGTARSLGTVAKLVHLSDRN